MSVRLNEDKEIVAKIREGLKRKGGHCPCKLEVSPATKCICQEFRDQIADPNYEGFCHCMLYYKSKDCENPGIVSSGSSYSSDSQQTLEAV